MVSTEDGWRAHWNQEIFRDQRFIRSIYQSQLAANVRSMGFSLEHAKNGEWEIAGVRKDVIEAFSKRQSKKGSISLPLLTTIPSLAMPPCSKRSRIWNAGKPAAVYDRRNESDLKSTIVF